MMSLNYGYTLVMKMKMADALRKNITIINNGWMKNEYQEYSYKEWNHNHAERVTHRSTVFFFF